MENFLDCAPLLGNRLTICFCRKSFDSLSLELLLKKLLLQWHTERSLCVRALHHSYNSCNESFRFSYFSFVFETDSFNGVGELLEILGR